MSAIRAPVMFIGHGSPRWALSPGDAAIRLREFSGNFDNVKAVLVISPPLDHPGNASDGFF